MAIRTGQKLKSSHSCHQGITHVKADKQKSNTLKLWRDTFYLTHIAILEPGLVIDSHEGREHWQVNSQTVFLWFHLLQGSLPDKLCSLDWLWVIAKPQCSWAEWAILFLACILTKRNNFKQLRETIKKAVGWDPKLRYLIFAQSRPPWWQLWYSLKSLSLFTMDL